MNEWIEIYKIVYCPVQSLILFNSINPNNMLKCLCNLDLGLTGSKIAAEKGLILNPNPLHIDCDHLNNLTKLIKYICVHQIYT